MSEFEMMLPAARQTPEQRAYFDGWFDGTQYLRVTILEGRKKQLDKPAWMIHDEGMNAAERHIIELRDKRLADVLAEIRQKADSHA